MKVVLLAGGYGTRISEESHLKPKPMIEIGVKPILWHIMKIYEHYGYCDFVICLGYKGYLIKEYFVHYYNHLSDITVDLENNNITVHSSKSEPWKVTLIDTGLDTMTGGRIKRIKKYVDNQTFMVTYGDGVSNVNINELLKFHKSHGKIATLTAVQPSGRFGALDLASNDKILSFQEKPKGDGSWINGGFFVLEPDIFDYLENDSTVFERKPLERLAKEGQLCAFKHYDFWQPMDTLRDKNELEKLWNEGNAKWKVWS